MEQFKQPMAPKKEIEPKNRHQRQKDFSSDTEQSSFAASENSESSQTSDNESIEVNYHP